MTDSVVGSILEGEGYHTFRGPRPIAWDQIYSDANWECVHRRAAVWQE